MKTMFTTEGFEIENYHFTSGSLADRGRIFCISVSDKQSLPQAIHDGSSSQISDGFQLQV